MLARNIKTRFASFTIRKVPRLENEQADLLSKIASGEVQNTHHIQVEVLHNPSTHVSETIHVITDEAKSWIDDIKDFIEQGILPKAPDQAKSVRRQSARYLIHDGLLYRRSFTKSLLRCIPPDITRAVLEELHEGVCGGHPGARALAERIIHQGYYWPTLRHDAEQFVKRCKSCQKFSSIPRLPSLEQTPVVATWPFDM